MLPDGGERREFNLDTLPAGIVESVEATSHDDVFGLAKDQLKSVVSELAGVAESEIDKSKVELGADKHH